MTVFLREQDVAARLSMHAAVDAVGDSFHRLARGLIRQEPRVQFSIPDGYVAVLAGIDEGLRLATLKSYAVIAGELRGFLVTVTSLTDGEVMAVIEADLLTKIRTGAASGVAAAALARPGATSVGIIGCGRQAPFQLEAVRCAMPNLTTAVAWTRRPEQLALFCESTGTTPAASAEEVAGCDIVVAATTSPTPVICGDWLRPGAVVIAIGGDGFGDRELDDQVIARARLITCDSIATSREEAADLWVPVAAGLTTWEDVVELQAIVAGTLPGRSDPDEIIVFKSSGLGAWDIAAAAVVLDDL